VKLIPNLFYLLIFCVITSCAASKNKSKPVMVGENQKDVKAEQRERKPIDVPYEFRAAWVATVANINWPSKPGLTVEEQKKEAISLLDSLSSLNFNAVIFQVRPQADALYASELEPWSYFLTKEQGKAPVPFYDPLDFWIKESHARGMELHAWLNPYRVHHPSSKELAATSIAHKMPESVVKLETGYYWFDPSLKSTQDHSLAVVKDIVKRYDIDGIHFDDYFYPYESYNGGKDFPDDASWKKYTDNGGTLSRGDWRRESVNTFIENVYKEIKVIKKDVKFGLSPFGIWRPGNPASISGMDQYSQLYADAKLWLNKGWIDYFSPQLYWPIGRIAQSYPVLLDWWQKENHFQRHLWPGINVSGITKDERGADEIENQIMISRGITSSSPGVVHWSISPLIKNEPLKARLRKGTYKDQALIPPSNWMASGKVEKPDVELEQLSAQYGIKWKSAQNHNSFKTIVYYLNGKVWSYRILGEGHNSLYLNKLTKDGALSRIEVAYVDRIGEIGEHEIIELN